ncbi:MAG: carbamate kinase [Anaerolineae bacterium]|jgi:carbamate kinase|nr:carbamate kinase [Anaerolineae bacterium]MBT7071748.1 carbamate kinase [Anaerolineae bacterium]MBT7325036.1 carbamate kinase [Anaerolineae bacterium]
MAEKKVAVVAIGGNALIVDKTKKSIPDQFDAIKETMGHIAGMIQDGWDVVITHGNGPQVGFILRRSELAAKELHPVPMDYCGADTQGAIGYMGQKALRNEFKKRGMKKQAVTVVTQVEVSADDPAFQKPAKPVGSFLDEETAKERVALGQTFVEDAGRGWRRVVPSPLPMNIVEVDAIKELVDAGFSVIAVGGGGIPVVEKENGNLHGVEAVIDKDFASGLLANNLDADLLIISTAVEKVALNFGKENEKWLDEMTVAEAEQYIAEGHFAPGSMLPKVQAIVKFLKEGGKKALITDPPNIQRALNGETGTWVLP